MVTSRPITSASKKLVASKKRGVASSKNKRSKLLAPKKLAKGARRRVNLLGRHCKKQFSSPGDKTLVYRVTVAASKNRRRMAGSLIAQLGDPSSSHVFSKKRLKSKRNWKNKMKPVVDHDGNTIFVRARYAGHFKI